MFSSKSGFSCLVVALSTLALAALGCSTDSPSTPTSTGLSVPEGQASFQDVDFPIPPTADFCAGTGVGTITDISTDAAAGLAYSSSIFMPAGGGNLNVYFANLGPGPITFVSSPGAWSVSKSGVPLGQTTEIPLTPKGSTADFSDYGWSGTFAEGTAYLGCVRIENVAFKSTKHKHATAHLDLSFLRDGVLHTVRVNVHVASDIAF